MAMEYMFNLYKTIYRIPICFALTATIVHRAP